MCSALDYMMRIYKSGISRYANLFEMLQKEKEKAFTTQ